MRVGGIVLCGGQSRRMGRPKAWLPFGREVLLQRIVRILAGVAHPICVVSAPAQDLPPLPSAIEIIHDSVAGRGPLEGLAAGLQCLKGRAEAAYLSSCDVPFLRVQFIERLIGLLGSAEAAVPRVDGMLHPLAAVYRVEVADTVTRLLGDGQRRLSSLPETIKTRFVEAEELREVDPALESLRNVNTSEDYALALQAWAARQP